MVIKLYSVLAWHGNRSRYKQRDRGSVTRSNAGARKLSWWHWYKEWYARGLETLIRETATHNNHARGLEAWNCVMTARPKDFSRSSTYSSHVPQALLRPFAGDGQAYTRSRLCSGARSRLCSRGNIPHDDGSFLQQEWWRLTCAAIFKNSGRVVEAAIIIDGDSTFQRASDRV